MICSFAHLLKYLENNPHYQPIPPIPGCPKHADIVCAKIAGNCKTGNNRQCEQRFSFFLDKTLFHLSVRFVWGRNTKNGYFDSNSISFQRMIDAHIITSDNLVAIEKESEV